MDDKKSYSRELARSSNAMSTNDKDSWYHCGHCGSLFQSSYGFDNDRLCEVCQRKPRVCLWPVMSSINSVALAKVASFDKTGDKAKKIAKNPTFKKRRFKTIFLVTSIWILVLLGVIALHYFLSSDPPKSQNLELSDLNRSIKASDRIKILNQVLPECDQVIRGFLSAPTNEEYSDYVHRSMEMQPIMEAYYRDHPLYQVNVASLQRIQQQWMHIGGEWMVLTHWMDAVGENDFNAVFRKGPDGWRLDWPHFSRYSEASWQSFLAGAGKSHQTEFRLLVRQFKDEKSTRPSDQRMLIVLAEPKWGKPKHAILESPVISIDLMSDEGRLLAEAFERREKKRKVGEGELDRLDPEGFVRVRVKVTRDEFGGEFRLTINELKVCHWLDSDHSGFE